MHEVLERETKWEVSDDFVVPRLDDIADGGDVERSTVELTSAYYDTADRDLQYHGVLLRRSDGDDDTGWQLKIPAEDGRTEIHYPLSGSPPQALLDILTGVSLGKPIEPIATIRTTRDRYRIGADSDQWCAELVDDRVRASVEDRLLAWREVEVELGAATANVPRRLAKRLTDAGAQPSRHSSKLERAAGVVGTALTPGRAAHALSDYIGTQIEAIFAGDLGLRRGRDPIHDTRVAIRRLRSTIRVFARYFDEAPQHLEDELKWFAGLLGEVRDCHVQETRFRAALADLPPELVLGPVAGRISGDLTASAAASRRVVTEAMGSSRYLDMLTTLQRWRNAPPVSDSLTIAALEKRERKARRKADRRLMTGIASGDDTLLHRARKAAKRARYAGELLKPLGGKEAAKNIKRYKRIQTVLGDHQDGAVAAATLYRLALSAGTTDGENGFTYGLLYAREQEAARQAKAAVRRLA